MSHKKKNIISSWHTVSFSIYSYPKGFSSGWTGPSNFESYRDSQGVIYFVGCSIKKSFVILRDLPCIKQTLLKFTQTISLLAVRKQAQMQSSIRHNVICMQETLNRDQLQHWIQVRVLTTSVRHMIQSTSSLFKILSRTSPQET